MEKKLNNRVKNFSFFLNLGSVEQELQLPLPVYAWVDLCYAGFKLAPIDINLFPAGFNNIHRDDYALVSAAFSRVLATQQFLTNTLRCVISTKQWR